jgi:hypothetical protein
MGSDEDSAAREVLQGNEGMGGEDVPRVGWSRDAAMLAAEGHCEGESEVGEVYLRADVDRRCESGKGERIRWGEQEAAVTMQHVWGGNRSIRGDGERVASGWGVQG